MWRSGAGSVAEAWGDCEAERETGAPSSGAEPRQQLAHRWHRGVIGRGLVVSWAVAGPHGSAASRAVPPSLKVVAALGQVCGGSSPPLPSSCLQSSGCARKAPLGQRIDGVDRRRGLRALVALRLLLVLLDCVLADEGAVLVELALPALAVVHQAVVALLLLDGAVQGRLAALQGLVVLVTARERQRIRASPPGAAQAPPGRERASSLSPGTCCSEDRTPG